MNTVLITGCSSGFGLDTAQYFLDRDWSVIATMRTPKDDVLPKSDRLRILPLDVTDAGSIAKAVADAGAFDVLVNNAGVGQVSPLEGVSMEKIRELFETNTLGTIAMTQAVLPQFRERGSGVIINVTSGVTFQPLPLMSIYTASKAAVNAFSESVAIELEPLGVRVRIVIPGRAPETPFGDNARERMGLNIPEAYQATAAQIFSRLGAGGDVTYSRDVSEAVWRAATDPSCPMRLPAGADAVARAAGATR
jgi:NAD(P)-dependent dehydrogenase (short-subunit alcohol dehydrogenase family)